jgi:hypothetical protein
MLCTHISSTKQRIICLVQVRKSVVSNIVFGHLFTLCIFYCGARCVLVVLLSRAVAGGLGFELSVEKEVPLTVRGCTMMSIGAISKL